MRVLTYNIRSGTDVLGRGRLLEQADAIRALGADVVLLQEVDRSTRRSARFDQAERLARLAGLNHVEFGPACRRNGGEYGNAILSRWELSDCTNWRVPRPIGWLPVLPLHDRGVLAATVVCSGTPVRLLSAHFGLLLGEAERAARMALRLAIDWPGPLVLGGDLNRPAASAACHRLLRTRLIDCARHVYEAPPATFPSPLPVLRLDYVYMRGLSVSRVEVPPVVASDHRPVLVEFGSLSPIPCAEQSPSCSRPPLQRPAC